MAYVHRRCQSTAPTVVKLGRKDFCFNVFSREQCLVALSHLFVSFVLSLEKKTWENRKEESVTLAFKDS